MRPAHSAYGLRTKWSATTTAAAAVAAPNIIGNSCAANLDGPNSQKIVVRGHMNVCVESNNDCP